MMFRHQLVAVLGVCILAPCVWAQSPDGQGTRLLRHPTVSRDVIVFVYAGDLWATGRNGGQARRLTSTPTVEKEPRLSPDGSKVAFTGVIGGNTDVYVVPTAGGDPKRLTFHPGIDAARGWSPDGRNVLFGSTRASVPHTSYLRLFQLPADGGFPDALPIPRAFTGAFSPDGRRMAYEEFQKAFTVQWHDASQWRHYRGGRTHPIRLIDLGDLSMEKLPWTDSNDSHPMWIGNTVYFLSDRANTTNLFSYRTDTKELKQLTRHADHDVMNASAGSDAIVYEQAGFIHLLDIRTGEARRLTINVTSDFPWARAQFKRVGTTIRDASLSSTGVRVALAARGDVFTVPVDKGDARNLTHSTAVHDRNPKWSPDGTQIAWFSDASGEYQLMIGDQSGLSKPRAITLPSPAYFSALSWAPDGKSVSFQDNHLSLWSMDVAAGKASKIDGDTYADPSRTFDQVWSPDSKWIAYSKNLDNHLRAIFIYSTVAGKRTQVTDGMSDAVSPAFDAGGKYLYFLASTDYGPRTGWLEMSSLDRPVRRAIYIAVLPANEPSPFLAEIGDEPAAPAARPRADSTAATTNIDAAGIGQRILPIDVPPGEYTSLVAGPAGSFFFAEPMGPGAAAASSRLSKYQVRERTAAMFLEGITTYQLSGDRKKLLYQAPGARLGVVGTDKPAKVGDGAVNVATLEAWVDPRAEWAQIFRETWRIQREFFYDERMQGANWNAVYAKYSPLLAHLGHRSDLGYVIAQMGGELAVGHSYLQGSGDEPTETPVQVGLLGAEFAIENGRYRIRRIYSGESWNPELRAPLKQPGVHVAEGDYILEVNGRPLAPATNIYALFEGTAAKQTVLRVNSTPSLEGSRLITVVPLVSDDALRSRAWVERNRRTVDSLSGGRLAYVWLPNTGGAGYTYFTRYYFAQQNKEGAVIDERYNQGGMVADYIVNELSRRPMGFFAQRDGKIATSPTAGIFGPKVMIINESAGSGGDALPYMFKQRNLGPLIGTRTWGALVGTLGVPPTIDGGGITAPSLAFYTLDGKWAVENEGVAPDIEVEYTPAEVMRGRDPQLERAVQEAMKLLEGRTLPRTPRPTPIVRTKGQ